MAKKSLDVRSLEETLCKAAVYMSVAARAEDAAIFVGTTKSGKSSLINFLIGNKLTGKRIGYKICVKKADNSHGPQIGVSATSETAIPTRYTSDKLSGYALWDAPGFNDNRGDNVDICNAFFTCELFKNIRSAKIILVVDIATFQDDSMHALRTLLTAVESLFTDKFKDTFPGIAMIVTKGDSLHGTEVTKDIITDFLQSLLSDDIDMSESGQDFISYLIRNPQNIGFFKKATEGPVTDDIEDGIIDAINNLHAIPDETLKEICPSISESAKVSLFKVREKLSSIERFVELQDVVVRALEDELKRVGNIENMENDEMVVDQKLNTEELTKLRMDLNVAKDNMTKVMDDTITFEKTISALKMVSTKIENFIEQNKLCEKAKYMEFVDKLLNLEESRNFSVCIKRIIVVAEQKLQELDIRIKWQIGEITNEQKNKEITEVTEKFQKKVKTLEDKITELEARKCTIL